MTPKEKAIELAMKFDKEGETACFHCVPSISTGHKPYVDNAKRCALIAVNELIEEHTGETPISWNVSRKRYWNEVKSEIEKL